MSMHRVTSPRRARSTWRRRATAAALTAALVATTAACHSSSGSSAAAPNKGGTLYVYMTTHPIANLDPQGISWAGDGNVSRLINRTLTTTTPDGVIVPDLATDTGRPNADNTVWDFTLKSGLKWQDGKAVTCADVKYGVERRWLPQIDAYGGLSYQMTYLVDNKTPFKGPTKNSSLDSIKCLDNNNVEFTLQQPAGDFGYTVSISTFAPVEVGSDSGNRSGYNWNPASNGPYKVDPNNTDKPVPDADGTPYLPKLTLIRNDFWSRNTDPVRKAYPDKIVFLAGTDNAQITNDLINSSGQYANSISLDQDVAPNFVQQVINDPLLSKRVLQGETTGVRYMAINTLRIPNVQCRKALEYGFDKRAWRFVIGGITAGTLATSMIPPRLPAHEDFDLYETKTLPDGDVEKSAKMIVDNKCKTTLKVAMPDVPIYHQLFSTVQEAYQRVGVEINGTFIGPASYLGTVRQTTSPYDMAVLGWVPDWPNGSAVLPPLFSGAQVGTSASYNLSMLKDQDIDNGIAQAMKEPTMQTQYRLWGDLDKQIMDKAAAIPILVQGALRMYGTNVRGVVLDQAYSQPDLNEIGLANATSPADQ
jgi:peptide/nickel transport system substrate-binding protein